MKKTIAFLIIHATLAGFCFAGSEEKEAGGMNSGINSLFVSKNQPRIATGFLKSRLIGQPALLARIEAGGEDLYAPLRAATLAEPNAAGKDLVDVALMLIEESIRNEIRFVENASTNEHFQKSISNLEFLIRIARAYKPQDTDTLGKLESARKTAEATLQARMESFQAANTESLIHDTRKPISGAKDFNFTGLLGDPHSNTPPSMPGLSDSHSNTPPLSKTAIPAPNIVNPQPKQFLGISQAVTKFAFALLGVVVGLSVFAVATDMSYANKMRMISAPLAIGLAIIITQAIRLILQHGKLQGPSKMINAILLGLPGVFTIASFASNALNQPQNKIWAVTGALTAIAALAGLGIYAASLTPLKQPLERWKSRWADKIGRIAQYLETKLSPESPLTKGIETVLEYTTSLLVYAVGFIAWFGLTDFYLENGFRFAMAAFAGAFAKFLVRNVGTNPE